MTVLLAIESGGEHFSAALLVRGKILCYAGESPHSKTGESPHSKIALPIVHRLLAEAELSLQQCDAFAFAAGPGRFSGLRMACGIAQSFAYATNRPGVQVGSFAALAEANYDNKISQCEATIPAHRGHIYAAHCNRDSTWRAPQPQLFSITDYEIDKQTKHVCGKFFTEPQPRANTNMQVQKNTDVQVQNCNTDATAVAKVAEVMLAEGDIVSAMECQPLYIRRQVAKTIAERNQK